MYCNYALHLLILNYKDYSYYLRRSPIMLSFLIIKSFKNYLLHLHVIIHTRLRIIKCTYLQVRNYHSVTELYSDINDRSNQSTAI